MQPVARMIVVGIVLALVAPATPSLAQATLPEIGTWELNLAKSKYDPGPPPKSSTRTYEAAGQGVKYAVKGIDAAGKPTLSQFTANFDGKDYPMTGSAISDTVSLKRIDTWTVETTQKKAGKVVAVTTRVISKDGKVMTVTGKTVNAQGQPTNNVTVYDKK